MSNIAIIGGSVLPKLYDFKPLKVELKETPFGYPTSPLQTGLFGQHNIVYLNRHGLERRTPPHKINYRANMWALKEAGVDVIIGLSVVAGIRSDMVPGHFVFPDQLIDYTYDRPSTCYEDNFDYTKHIDFTYPYCPVLHRFLVEAAQELTLDFTDDATYGVTQGPRFETIAEINRMERDGCDIVGMTAMPEALLARELGMRYASIALVASKAAGRSDGLGVSLSDMKTVIDDSLAQMYQLLLQVVGKIV
ncbi:MAG: S-methyl-5'-thioinosine phosphorylase [Gammaproteobacteria bacterium]|nr:S-methyl-5'-thioinosine phosphorylase [Gammaproteobacteria bacterium]